MNSILGQKIGMTRVLNKKGVPQSSTIIQAGPCYISQIRTEEKDGYQAVQLAFGTKKKIKKPQKNHLKKSKIDQNLKCLIEFRVKDTDKYQPGQEIKTDIFKEGDRVEVTGISKGKGFAGVIKRHNFSRGPETHGSHHHRRPGSIGSMFPQRVIKGRKMPGHMGVDRITTKNLKILKIDSENNLIAIKGAVPGSNKGFIQIKKINKK